MQGRWYAKEGLRMNGVGLWRSSVGTLRTDDGLGGLCQYQYVESY
jgi:hypothetical protein